MELSHLFLQEASIEVRVDFRGRDLGVSQHFLNRPQVGTAFDEVGGETVAEGVGTHVFPNASRDDASLQHGEGHLSRHFPSLAAQEQRVFVPFQRNDVGAVMAQVVINAVARLLPYGHDALFVALADHSDKPFNQVNT